MSATSAQGPRVEHNGTVPVWWMVESREMRDLTDGGFFELVNEFEVAAGAMWSPTRTRPMSFTT